MPCSFMKGYVERCTLEKMKNLSISDRSWETNDSSSHINSAIEGNLKVDHEPFFPFEKLKLKPELLRAVKEAGLESPSETQRRCIPQAICGRDIFCHANSDMGKTAIFVISVLEQLSANDVVTSLKASPQVLVLAPTRELAFQIVKQFQAFKAYMRYIRLALFVGGLPLISDITVLLSRPLHIVVGTPGRILALVNSHVLMLGSVKHFILDECDKMLAELDMRQDVQDIFRQTPQRKQTMMFSATMPWEMVYVCGKFMRDPFRIAFQQEQIEMKRLVQFYIPVKEDCKNEQLMDFLDQLQSVQAIIFVKSIVRCIALNNYLHDNNFPSIAIHSGMTQDQRLVGYQQLKTSSKHLLVATDLFGRGINMEKVHVVINYDCPAKFDVYFNRISRAGRYPAKGLALTLVADSTDATMLTEIQDKFSVDIVRLPDIWELDALTISMSESQEE